MKRLGDHLRDRREAAGLSLDDVSERTDQTEQTRIPASTLGRIERNERRPGWGSLVKLARGYGVEFHVVATGWAIEWEGEIFVGEDPAGRAM